MNNGFAALSRFASTGAIDELEESIKRIGDGGSGSVGPTNPIYTAVPVDPAASPYAVQPQPATHIVVLADPTTGPIIVTCPPAPTVGEVFTVTDVGGSGTTGNNVTVDGNGHQIQNAPTFHFNAPLTLNRVDFASYTFMYTAQGWRIIWNYVPVFAPGVGGGS